MPSIPNTSLETAVSAPAPARTAAWPIPSASAGGAGPARAAAHRHHEYQQHRQAAFQALRPITTQLLLLRDQPERLQPQLLALRQLLVELPAEGLEACWDYVAFPLMVLIDAVMPSRQAARSAQAGGAGGAAGGDGPGGAAQGELCIAACRSDRVVEALLGALLALLEPRPTTPTDRPGQAGSGTDDRAGGGSGRVAANGPSTDRAVAALQRLAPLMQLPREQASEEVHVAVQRCVAAALAPLAAPAACGDSDGNAASGGPGDGGGGAALCSQELAPLAGYLLHCCLEVSEREVLAGHKGSKALCAAALTSLGALLAALTDPDVMAFFLPGVVSGLSKILYAAGTAAASTGPSSPPGAAATVQALTCLRTAATAVLSDESTAAILGPDAVIGGNGDPADAAGSHPLPALSDVRRAEDALSVLKHLSLGSEATTPAAAPGTAAAASAPAAAAAAPEVAGPQQRRRLRVDRTRQWLHDASGRINSLLGRVLPPLCSNPRPAVRCELAVTVAALLDVCGAALAPSQPLLLQLLFTLAQDEWRQVAAPCLDWVARRAPPQVPIAAAAAPPPLPGAAPSSVLTAPAAPLGAGAGGSAGAGEGSVAPPADLKSLEDEFERFMQGLMSDSVLLEQPALEVDELELYGGSDDGAGGRDQGATAPLPPALPALAAAAAIGAGAGATANTAEESAAAVAGPPPPALPGLQHLIAESATSVYLLRAVRSGEAEAVVRARCLTTALQLAGPGRGAEWLLLRPAALSDLLAGLFRCFAFDRNAATLVLHLRGEAGSYAPSVTPAVAGAVTTPAPAGGAAAADLPRMPLGLLHLASQRSYSALAALARSLGRLARAADVPVSGAAAAVGPHAQRAGGGTVGGISALRRLVDELSTDLRRVVARGAADASVSASATASGGSGKRGGTVTATEEAEGVYEEGEEELRNSGGGRGGAAAALATVGLLGEGSWQCEAAAVVAVMAEVVFGASNAWTPPLDQLPPPSQQQQPDAAETPPPAPPFPATDPSFDSIILGFLQELMRPGILKLPTHNVRAAGGGAVTGGTLSYDDVVHPDLAAAMAAQRPLSVQSLGENVMLLRGVLEAVGTAARAVGPHFATQGRLLRAVLVPLLELLGDPSPPVAAAADTALKSICAHCGYGGSLTSLLGANADYVVDSLCARLRDLNRHPRAPQLMAALLRRAGVAPQLLPLMAEPLQRTLQGLSPLARHWAPHYSHPYLAVLRELAAGAAAESAAAGEDSSAAVAELNRLAEEAQRNREQEAAEAEAAAAAASGRGSGSKGAAEGPVSHEEVRRFFVGRNGAAAAGDGEEDGDDGWQRRPLLTLSAGQLEDAELRFRRLHAAATVAGAAADAATPLLLSSDLRAAMAAAEVLRGALAALAASTPAVEAEAAMLEEYGGPEARMRPVRPETPKVLPVVAAAWTPLMAALRDSRTPVVERSLGALAELVEAGGGTFLARRFQQEAWPVLQRLLTHGSAHTPGLLSLGTDAARAAPSRRRLEIGAPASGGSGGGSAGTIVVSGGEDAALAPAAVSRVRVAALRCLEAVCRCRDAAVAVRTLTWGVAQAALPFLGSSHPPPLHEAAQATLLAAAALDPDGVWLLLYDTSCNMPPALASAATSRAPGGAADKQQQLGVVGTGACPGPEFPSLRVLLPPLPGAGAGRYGQTSLSFSSSSSSCQPQWPVTAALAADCGPRAQSLLGTVAAFDVPWHATKVPMLEGDGAETWA